MQPTPSKFKKFLVPGVIIIGLVLVGVLLFMKGGTIDQGAALFSATTKTASIKTGITGTLNPNTQPLPCFAGSTTPKIKVMSPNGGETYQAGQQITVKWSTCNIPANAHITEIDLTMINGLWGGGTGVVLNKDADIPMPNTGQFTVMLPTAQQFSSIGAPYGTYFKIQIHYSVPNGSVITDVSDNLFTIASAGVSGCLPNAVPWIHVLSPVGGVWDKTVGGYVTWNHCNIPWNGGTKISLINQSTGVAQVIYDPSGYNGPLNPIWPFSDGQRLLDPSVSGWWNPAQPASGQYKIRVECRISGTGQSCNPNSSTSYFGDSGVFAIN